MIATISRIGAPEKWRTPNRVLFGIGCIVAAGFLYAAKLPPGDPWVSTLVALSLAVYAVWVASELFWTALIVIAAWVVLTGLSNASRQDVANVVLFAGMGWLALRHARLVEQQRLHQLAVADQLFEMQLRIETVTPYWDADETEAPPEG